MVNAFSRSDGKIPIFTMRKSARYLSYRNRVNALTSNEQVELRSLKNIILLLKIKKNNDNITDVEERLLRLSMFRYLEISTDFKDDTLLPKPQRMDRDINSFPNSSFRYNFRFLKPELQDLFKQLKFPDQITLENRSIISGEDVFLRGLYELCSGENKQKICENVFGREGSTQSRAFTYFINHIYENFHHLVHDNLAWWHRNGYLEESMNAIAEKMGLDVSGKCNVAAFIDCNCLATSRVGGGPAEEGANARRWSSLIQEAFYNGWKSVHGLKHQTVDIAHGMTIDIFGPTSLRRNDLVLLRESDVNGRLSEVLKYEKVDANDVQYIIFGDSAYRKQSHISSYLQAEEEIENYQVWNQRLKKVRISIEWNYGYTATLFKYLSNHDKLKIMESNTVSKVYTVATLLRNLHVGYYGSQSSNYFNLQMRQNFVEYYLNQRDF